jgi:quinol monooxygenase YgiN
MSKAVHWLLKIEIAPDNLSSFKTVMDEMILSAQGEPDTLAYEWCFNENETFCGLYERFRDSAAAKLHLTNFGQFAERFVGACTSIDMIVLGNPNDEVKSMLSGLSPIIVEFQAGFERCINNTLVS